MTSDSPDAPKLTFTGALVAIAMGVLFLIVLVEVVLRVAMPEWREFYSGRFMRVLPVANYGEVPTGRPSFDGYFAQNNGDFRARITINKFGLRDNEPIEAAANRIWVVGDSMTFGWGVGESERYSSVIAKASGVPTYNVASPGTGVCGYRTLVHRMPQGMKPRAVVIGLILENDISAYDCDLTWRTFEQTKNDKNKAEDAGPVSSIGLKVFLTEHSSIYNVLTVKLKRIGWLRELFTSIGIIRNIDTYATIGDGADIPDSIARTTRELVNLRQQLPENTPFVVLIAPGRFELLNGDATYKRVRLAVGDSLAKSGIASIDPYDAFYRVGLKPTHFAHDGHWTALGHDIAGKAVANWLKGNME